MADLEGVKVAKQYHVDTPFANQNGFYLKGCNSLDWGMKRHMANIFNPKSGNTVMFAFDHGYFMGSTAGLERLDLLLPKLAPYGNKRRHSHLRSPRADQCSCIAGKLWFQHAAG